MDPAPRRKLSDQLREPLERAKAASVVDYPKNMTGTAARCTGI